MATYYVRSTDGNNADDGSTWTLAKADTLAPTWAAGDVIYVSQVHSHAPGSANNLVLGNTLNNPTRVICGNDASEPPTSVAATAVIATTGAYSIAVRGVGYVDGIIFKVGLTSNGSSLTLTLTDNDNNYLRFRNCEFWQSSTGAGFITLGASSSSIDTRVAWENCCIRFAAAGTILRLYQSSFTWTGGGVVSGGTSPTAIFQMLGTNCNVLIDSVDFSNFSAGVNIVSAPSTGAGLFVMRNCKLPASWSGVLGVPTVPQIRLEMHNCDAGDTNYRLIISEYAGLITSETTIKRTGGASDGATGLSWKMVSTANTTYPTIVLASPEIVQWNATTGSSLTATVEIVHDSQGAGTSSAFLDGEIWVEITYLGTSGYPLGTWTNDAPATILTTAADQTSSSETWTTTGLTTPVKQKLSVTFTPQEKGFVRARVLLAKASKTVYVCPKLTVA